MFTAVLLAAPLLAAAPALKEPAKAPGLVGEWVVERHETGGEGLPFPGVVRFVFTADGKWAWYAEGCPKVPDRAYTVDLAAKPQAIDLGSEPGAPGPGTCPGVFRVEGDTLTLCHSVGRHPRPKGFTVSADDPVSRYVMKRVK
jgi:uncharacterized protein (TIGR03067 family)